MFLYIFKKALQWSFFEYLHKIIKDNASGKYIHRAITFDLYS